MRATILLALVLSGCTALNDHAVTGQRAPGLADIQVIGSHNSYKQAIDPGLLAQLAADDPRVAGSLDYSHLPLEEQLDAGMRKLELDVFDDPLGGRYSEPLGYRAIPGPAPWDPGGVMKLPGFKVFHVQDIDFRSHCLLLADCLASIVAWSDRHPRHLPLFVMINAKDAPIDRAGFTVPLRFNADAWQRLDDALRAGLGPKLLAPDEIRGNFPTLRSAVLAGWPSLDSLRGRVLVTLDDSNKKKQDYISGHPSLAGRAMFVDAPADSPEAAIMVINDPVNNREEIRRQVEAGFIVRTRADADTVEARRGSYDRLAAALDSGAQIISTDYYVADKRFGTGYVVQLPGGVVARCNPVTTSSTCEISD